MTFPRTVTLLVAATMISVVARQGPASADGADACPVETLDRALADVARARAGVTTLTGPFTQDRTIGLLAAKVHSTGTLTLVRPDRLRWELAPPDSVIYWITPDGAAYRSPSGQGEIPAANQQIAAALGDLRRLLGGDLDGLRGRYDLSATCRPDSPMSFRAVPRPSASVPFQEIRFTLAPDLVSPQSVTIIEGPHDRTEIRFGALRANVPVASELMSPRAR
jgi:hypothetical protein